MFSLNLAGCPVEDPSLQLLSQRCVFLQELVLAGCDQLTDSGLEAVARYNRKLVKLDLEGCQLVTDLGVVEVFTFCRGLLDVNLSRCQLLTDETLIALGECCRGVEHIKIAYLLQLTDRGLYNFASFAKAGALQTLDVTGCRKFSDEGIMVSAEEERRYKPILVLVSEVQRRGDNGKLTAHSSQLTACSIHLLHLLRILSTSELLI